MTAQFNVIMNTMQQTMSPFRAELRRDQEETVEKAAKKARLTTEVTFRRKGNEKQYRFNELVQDKLASTSLCIEEASANAAVLNPIVTTTSASSSTSTNSVISSTTGPALSALQQAKASVEEGMTLLKDRQKAIRLADRSELGWAVVNEYGEAELAEDSEDEKRIAKAVATEEKRAAQLKKKKSGRGGYTQSRPADVPSRGPRQVESGQQGARISRIVGPCFSCGDEMGHLRRNCPKNLPPRPYPLYNDCMHISGSEVGILDSGGSCINCGNDGIYDVSCSPVSLEGESTDDCPVMGQYEYAWEPNDKFSEVIQVQGRLKQHLEYWEQVLKAPDYIIDSIRNGYSMCYHCFLPHHHNI